MGAGYLPPGRLPTIFHSLDEVVAQHLRYVIPNCSTYEEVAKRLEVREDQIRVWIARYNIREKPYAETDPATNLFLNPELTEIAYDIIRDRKKHLNEYGTLDKPRLQKEDWERVKEIRREEIIRLQKEIDSFDKLEVTTNGTQGSSKQTSVV